MEQNKLISFALSFASFLIDRIEAKSVILFGSVATNNFDEESDIDLFIETSKKNENKIKGILELYKKTKEHENFKLTGIKNEFSLKYGNLEEWKVLKRAVVSNGIVLYGKYQGQPENLKRKLLFTLDLEKLVRAKKVKIWRKIYGYKQKVGKKVYLIKGMAEKKLGRGAFIVSVENSKEILNFLKKQKVK